jgi:hypothetical protein
MEFLSKSLPINCLGSSMYRTVLKMETVGFSEILVSTYDVKTQNNIVKSHMYQSVSQKVLKNVFHQLSAAIVHIHKITRTKTGK